MSEGTLTDKELPDNYVEHVLHTEKPSPPIDWNNWWKELNHTAVIVIVVPPLLSIWGLLFAPLHWQTAVWAVVYYFITGIAITAGYHRLWAHRAYKASKVLEYVLAVASAGAIQGTIRWWCRGHRAHHRYTDTELDPYNAQHGFWYTHVGWMLFKPRRKPGVADVSDLIKNKVVRWQSDNYSWLALLMAFGVPTVVAGVGWGDWKGGYFYAGVIRLVFVQHSTFCVNSLAHWLGEAPFDDKHSPRDHFLTALATLGEGYHNFHHQFPMDYRNATQGHQYDPTKWTIWLLSKLGFASHLKVFPENEVRKGQLTMQLKRLREVQDELRWPHEADLPVIDWASFQEQAAQRPLILIAGFIHDVSNFLDEHPGGRHLVAKYIGKDATTAFFGGVYEHSNAAHNLLSMKRVGILHGGHPQALDEKKIPPALRLRIARYGEMGNLSSSAFSDDGEDVLD